MLMEQQSLVESGIHDVDFRRAHVMTNHARRRQQRFALSWTAIAAAMTWGKRVRQAEGRVRFHLGKRGVQRARAKGIRVEQWIKTTVVMGQDRGIITVGKYEHPKHSHRKPRCQGRRRR